MDKKKWYTCLKRDIVYTANILGGVLVLKYSSKEITFFLIFVTLYPEEVY